MKKIFYPILLLILICLISCSSKKKDINSLEAENGIIISGNTFNDDNVFTASISNDSATLSTYSSLLGEDYTAVLELTLDLSNSDEGAYTITIPASLLEAYTIKIDEVSIFLYQSDISICDITLGDDNISFDTTSFGVFVLAKSNYNWSPIIWD